MLMTQLPATSKAGIARRRLLGAEPSDHLRCRKARRNRTLSDRSSSKFYRLSPSVNAIGKCPSLANEAASSPRNAAATAAASAASTSSAGSATSGAASAASATSATLGKLFAESGCSVFLVEDVERSQADVDDFFLMRMIWGGEVSHDGTSAAEHLARPIFASSRWPPAT
jgi:hypothetical protein